MFVSDLVFSFLSGFYSARSDSSDQEILVLFFRLLGDTFNEIGVHFIYHYLIDLEPNGQCPFAVPSQSENGKYNLISF